MRTRASNKTQRFTYAAETAGSDGEEAEGAATQDDGGDANLDGDADAAEDEEALSGGGSATGDEESSLVPDTVARRSRRRARRKAATRIPLAPAAASQDPAGAARLHEVPAYPVDLRATRIYTGPLRRWHRFRQLAEMMYGPDLDHVDVLYDMMNRWCGYPLLPSKLPAGEGAAAPTPWLPDGFEGRQAERALAWWRRRVGRDLPRQQQQRTHRVPAKHAERFVSRGQGAGELAVLLGPHDEQKEFRLRYGRGHLLSETGAPAADPETSKETLSGWIFDVEGLPLSMGWAPLPGGSVEQVLALAVVPHSDQVCSEAEEEGQADEKRDGCVQFWGLRMAADDQGVRRPAPVLPGRLGAVCFDWGRPKRIQWCPVPLRTAEGYGLLAILCGDGRVRVISVPSFEEGSSGAFDWIDDPVDTLGFTDEYAVPATCMTWCGASRLCLGHADGSLALWSVRPRQLLARHQVHISHVLDVASGWPSRPSMIASTPVGGCQTLTDLALPSAESTYVPMMGGVSFQPGLIDWNDHLQGWFNIYPSPTPYNTIVGFQNVKFFLQSRTMVTLSAGLVCLAAGRGHPYLLVGCADGSVWALNGLKKLMADRSDEGHKLRVLQHEFRDVEGGTAAGVRGAVRILQGFAPEVNTNPRTDFVREQQRTRNGAARPRPRAGKGKAEQGPGQWAAVAAGEDEEGASATAAGVEDETGGAGAGAGGGRAKVFEVSRAAIYHPWSRITALAWNPNVEFGCWAAVAMGSGLVRVMDLGVA